MVINAPSLANCDILNLENQINQLIAGDVSFLHVDIADGNYVKNILFPLSFVKTLRKKYPHVEIDVHLMVTDPFSYVERMARDGANYLSFHIDSTNFSRRLLKNIREAGMKAGVVINPSQPISLLAPLLPFCDYVVLMTVEPGFAGQTFMPEGIERLRELCELREEINKDILISIDGGIDYENTIKCRDLGANIFISGIYTVFNQPEGLVNACLRYNDTIGVIKE